MKLFRVMWYEPIPRERTPDRMTPGEVPQVPYDLVDQHAEQCQRNHYQTPKRLLERGGLDITELAAVLMNRPWKMMTEQEALVEVNRCIEGFNYSAQDDDS